ncbi:hypothetical protein CRG98_043461 [Punica granatum]|uniref:Endonuclease/exonuclease/phosphatase domain-containing protein n=1 Tax=Punica granatum TaxID=22663 RepID=A0A2I0HWT8_PUNGR|nr:hypothetical protein CRG98_043461 [Punica granatum]
MSLLAWNCRGVRGNPIVRALRLLIRKHRPSIIFLSEAKSCSRHCNKIKQRCNLDDIFSVESSNTAGGFCPLWNTELKIAAIRNDNQEWSQDHEGIGNYFLRNFQDLFNSSHLVISEDLEGLAVSSWYLRGRFRGRGRGRLDGDPKLLKGLLQEDLHRVRGLRERISALSSTSSY